MNAQRFTPTPQGFRPVSVKRGRKSPGELSPDDVVYIRRHYRAGTRHNPGNAKELAQMFNITVHWVRVVVSGRVWKDLG